MKQIVVLCLSVTLLVLPVITSAFSIVNATRNPFTVSINQHCSTEFGNVQVNRDAEVSDAVMLNLCGQHTNDCIGRIHQSQHCSGLEIGSFAFDHEGVVKTAIGTTAQGYSVKAIIYMNLVAVGQN